MSLSRHKVSSMEKYDKEITKLSTSIILLQCRRTFRSIPIFLSWKGKLAASTKVKIIPTPLLHSFCSAPPPPEIESQLRAWSRRHTLSKSICDVWVKNIFVLSNSAPGLRIIHPNLVLSATGSPSPPIRGFVAVFIRVYSPLPRTTWMGSWLFVSLSSICTALRCW
jgi:hypothetical protein